MIRWGEIECVSIRLRFSYPTLKRQHPQCRFCFILQFQMRNCMGHTFLCQCFSATCLYQSEALFSFPLTSNGIPGAQTSKSTTVLAFHPSFLQGGGATDAS